MQEKPQKEEKQEQQTKNGSDSNDSKQKIEEERLQLIHKKTASLYHNARNRASDRGLDFSLTKEFISVALKKGHCAKTGVKFEFSDVSGGKQGTSHPWSPSIDRIDSNKGYTPKNSQIVALIYNRAKGADKEEDMLILAKSIVNAERRKKSKNL